MSCNLRGRKQSLEQNSIGGIDRFQMPLTFQYLPAYHDLEDNLGYVDPFKTGATISSKLSKGVKFDITSAMIQLVNLKGMFAGLPMDDANMDIINFIGI